MESKIKEEIESAEKVLIGIGEDFEERFDGMLNIDLENNEKENPLYAGYKKINHRREKPDAKVMEAYRQLHKLIGQKDYFIVTLCTDDRIYETPFDQEKIVAPCGTYRFLQCPDNCNGQLLPVTEKMIEKNEKIVCPDCKKEMVFNRIFDCVYNENGYLAKWENYRKWLQQTLNKKICVLELGVGMKYPTVIRWPFEKIIFYQNKATLIRVHETLFQAPEGISEKCISISANPMNFLCDLFVNFN